MLKSKLSKFLLIPSLLITSCLLLLSCEEIVILLTEPENLMIETYTDSVSIKLSWDPVVDASGYRVYFNDGLLATVSDEEYVHLKPMETGDYYVTAYRGATETEPSNTVTDVPVVTEDTLAEIEAKGNSGFGWDRTTGNGTSYSMGDSAHAPNIDFYFTNFVDDYRGGPYSGDYYIASPDEVINDPGVTWPIEDNWRQTGFTKLTPIFNNVDTLPPTGYDNYQDVTIDYTYGVYTWDGYYGMVEVESINTDSGSVEVKTAFQTVKGLRLIKVGTSTLASSF
jgi:hypothetical protein